MLSRKGKHIFFLFASFYVFILQQFDFQFYVSVFGSAINAKKQKPIHLFYEIKKTKLRLCKIIGYNNRIAKTLSPLLIRRLPTRKYFRNTKDKKQ